ncbi:MAG: SDR family NAD(P)-dependent oxidoreductase [Acidimicrobiia bacterium]
MAEWKSALVTGASSGIGEAIVRRLAADGVPTVVVARRADRLEALAAELPGIEVLAADLTDRTSLARVEARVAAGIDLVVNNAGFGTSGPLVEIDADRSTQEIELNVVALTRLTRAALPGMIERRRGWIMNISSVAGFQGAAKFAVYSATKAYVTSFSEGVHGEVKGHGVIVTAVCPGLTESEFVSVSRGADRGPSPMHKMGFAWQTSDDVAATALADTAKGKTISVPGALNKAMAGVSSVSPRRVTRFVAGLLSR